MAVSRGRPSHYGWMIPILLLAFLLRIAYLNAQSLWWDEAFSFAVSSADLPSLIEDSIHDRVHPPLYYALMHFWLILGHEEFLLRFFSVLSGTISVSIMYVAASLVGRTRLGLVAAVLLAISPFNVWYSQEVRMYSLTTMLVLAASAAFLRLLRDDALVNWVVYGLLSLLALYSTYLYLFAALGHVVFLVILRSRYPALLKRWFFSLAVPGILFLPWLLAIFTTGGFYSASISWISPANMSDLFWTLYSLAVGVTTDPRSPFYLTAALIAVSFIACGLISLKHRPTDEGVPTAAVWIWLVLPLLLIFVISLDWPLPQKRSIYIDRFLNPLLPAFLILLGLGIRRAVSARRTISSLALAVLVIAIGFSMRNLYCDTSYGRDQWREAVAHINASGKPGDLVLVRPHDYAPLYYYNLQEVDGLTVPYLSSPQEYRDFLDSEVPKVLTNGGKVWSMTVCENANAHRFVYGARDRLLSKVADDDVRTWLLQHYQLLEERLYNGIYLASYGSG